MRADQARRELSPDRYQPSLGRFMDWALYAALATVAIVGATALIVCYVSGV
jgi:hypothetical protein